VRRIFLLCAEGRYSLENIAALLTAEGIPTPGDRRPGRRSLAAVHVWQRSTVSVILRNTAYIGTLYDGVAPQLTACHYPKLCSLGAIRTPSTKACKVFIPCQSVCHPGKPSLVRLRCPPKRPMARATSRTVRSVRPDFWHKTSSSRGLQPAWAAAASGCLRRRARSSIRRRATTLMIATAANSLSALSHCRLSAPSPVLIAL
jgi:Recombinase